MNSLNQWVTMKRNLTASREHRFKAPQVARGIEKQFGDDVAAMIDAMARSYRRGAIDALHVSTINKFADAQAGNYASIFLKLSKSVQRKLLRRFANKRIEAMVNNRLTKADKSNSARLYAKIAQRVGFSAKELAATEGMTATRNALIAETANWIKKTRDETLEHFTANTLHAMTRGEGIDKIMEKFDGMVETRKNHARFVAQNQINNFNSIVTKTRAVEVGVTRAIWRTEGDDRVRDSHADRDGKEFDLREGCFSSLDGVSLLPQVDYNCRCDYELIIPAD
jgi:SPP1 gp7 family putative phage head morphogenesis protein